MECFQPVTSMQREPVVDLFEKIFKALAHGTCHALED